jgi:hypothetical protein
MTIMAPEHRRSMNELPAEITAVNDVGAEQVRLVTPLLPGELRDLREISRAQHRLRGREGWATPSSRGLSVPPLADGPQPGKESVAGFDEHR